MPRVPEWLATRLHAVVRPVDDELERLRQFTLLRSWPSDHARRVLAVGLAGDHEHVRLLLDAVATFHPGARVSVLLDAEGNAPLPDADALHERYGALESLTVGPIRTSPDWALAESAFLLHPWPYMQPELRGRVRALRWFFSRQPALRKYVLFRDLELWNGALWARAWRRLLMLPQGAVHAAAAGLEHRILSSVAAERGVSAGTQWPAPCAHHAARVVFRHPVVLRMCPTCGMGLPDREAGSDRVERREEPPPLRGAGRFTAGLYLGSEQWLNLREARRRRLVGNLEALGLDDGDLSPERRRALEYRCRDGVAAAVWRARGWSYLGVDGSAEHIELARDSWTREFGEPPGPEVTFAQRPCGGEAVRETDGFFRMIVLDQALEREPDPVALLRRLRERASAPGGWLHVVAANAADYTWNPLHRGFARVDRLWHFSPGMLGATVRAAGWAGIRVHYDADRTRFPFISLLAVNPLRSGR